MRRMLIVGLLLIAMPVTAQQVHKCQGRDGVPVYQNDPCPDAPAVKTWDARPHYVSSADQTRIDRQLAEARQAQEQRRRQRTTPVYSVSHGTQSQSRHARCEAAKLRRERELEILGLRRTYNDLSRLGRAVYEACK